MPEVRTMAKTFTQRMIGAATLDAPTYEEVEHDRAATGQAAAVVALAAAGGAIGSLAGGPFVMLGAVISAFIGWILWSFATLIIGTKVFDGTADMGEMLRALGFAQAIGIVAIAGILPGLGVLVRIAVGIWMLVCGIIAIRQALDFTTGKAVGTVLVGWLVYAVLGWFVSLLSLGF